MTANDNRHIPASDVASADTDRRRAALRRILMERGLTPSELARRAGLSTPNSLFNFLNGHSQSISLRVLEQILTALPDLSADDLLGRRQAFGLGGSGVPTGHRLVRVTMEARGDLWFQSPTLPERAQLDILVPERLLRGKPDLLGVFVAEVGAELAYTAGAVLICEPVQEGAQPQPDGCHLIVAEYQHDAVRLSLREPRSQDGYTWLWPRSTHPECQQPLLAPWHLQGAARSQEVGYVRIIGRVLAALTPGPESGHI